MTAEVQRTRAIGDDYQARYDAAERDRRAAKRDLADARRRATAAREIQRELEEEATRLGLDLVITRHSREA